MIFTVFPVRLLGERQVGEYCINVSTKSESRKHLRFRFLMSCNTIQSHSL